MRIILYTGKGGVGKTSIAVATALNIAKKGKKVLIMSTDQAHSLSDSVELKLENSPRKVFENLWAMEIDSIVENEKLWGSLKRYIESIILMKNEKSIENEELLVFPGFEELLSLIKINEIEKSGKYDVLIIDCAPTGETLSLLKFPELFKWWMEKVFPMKKKAAKVAGPIIEKTVKIPMPKEDTFNELEEIQEKLLELSDLLSNKEKTSIRIVTTPEKIVIKESKRNFTYLQLYNFNVDSIVINKIMPKEESGYFRKWLEIQEESIEDIEKSFVNIPILKSELLSKEARGVKVLECVGDKVFEGTNSEDILYKRNVFELVKLNDEDGSYVYRIFLPFIDKKDFDLHQKGDEITISINNERRTFFIPKKLQGKDVVKALYKDAYLELIFS